MKVFNSANSYVLRRIVEEFVEDVNQLCVSNFRAEQPCNLVNAASQRFLRLKVVRRCQLQVHFAESRPLFVAVDVDKCREVVGRIVADVLAAGLLGRVEEEVSDSLVDCCYVLELSYEWPNVLECRATDNFRCRVLKELKVQVLHVGRLLLQRADLRYLSNDIRASLPDLLLLVLGELLVQGEDLSAEAVD